MKGNTVSKKLMFLITLGILGFIFASSAAVGVNSVNNVWVKFMIVFLTMGVYSGVVYSAFQRFKSSR